MNWFVIISLLLLVLFVWIILFNLFVPSQITSSADRSTEFDFQRNQKSNANKGIWRIGRERRGWIDQLRILSSPASSSEINKL